MKRNILIILASVFLCLHSLHADEKYVYEVLDESKGLSDNYLSAIFCDSKGLMWIGSRFGLDWYDGYRIRHVTVPSGMNVTVLRNSIFEDADHRILVGTDNGLLVVESGGHVEKMVSVPISRSIVQTSDKILWTPSISRHIRSIDPNDFSVTTYPFSAISIALDDKDNIYFNDNNGNIFKSSDKLKNVSVHIKVDSLLTSLFIHGNMLFACGDNFSKIYDLNTGVVLKEGLPSINDIVFDGKRLWLATGRGLRCLDGNMELRDIRDINDAQISSGVSRCVAIDSRGGIWYGHSGGVTHVCDNRWGVSKINVPNCGRVYKTLWQDGYLWMATSKMGLLRHDVKSGVTTEVNLHISGKEIREIYSDADDFLISTWRETDRLIRLDRKTLKIQKYDNLPGLVSNFLADSRGRLWIGVLRGSGYVMDGKFVPTSTKHINTMIEYPEGTIWTGVRTYGLTKTTADGESRNYSYEDGNFLSRSLIKLICSEDGNIWALTEVDGLFRYDESSDSFVAEDRLPSSDFGRFLGMSSVCNKLFIATKKGLILFDCEGGNWSFIKKEGIFRNSFYGKDVCLGDDSKLYIGSQDGVLVCDLNAIQKPVSAHRTVFSSFSVIQTGVKQDARFELEKDIDKMDRIVLPHDCNSFRIYMTDMDFHVLKAGRMQYRLAGYNESWKNVRDGSIAFLNVPTGRYTLDVRTIENDGTVSKDGRTIKMVIRPPFFAHPLMIVLYILLIMSAIWFFSRLAVRKAEAQAETAAALKEAESEKMLYASKVEFLSDIAHEIRTPLSLVKLPVDSLAKRLERMKDPQIREDLNTLMRNAEALRQQIDDLLDFQKLEHASYKLDPVERDICTLTSEIIGRFNYLVTGKDLQLSVDIPSKPVSCGIDTHIFDKIISNLMSNAIKYSQTYIKASLNTRHGKVVFEIENDGVVVPRNMRDRIFTAFVRYEEGRHYVEGTGIGLSSARKFAELLGGTLAMDSDESVNRFVLTLPVVHLEQQTPPPSPAEVVHPLRFGVKVLIVEDNREMKELLSRAFSSEYDVKTAADGLAALKTMEKGFVPSIIISDVMMPHMDGFELCSRIRSNAKWSSIPVILLTAKPGDDAQIQGLRSGADAYINKPFSMGVLVEMTKSLLENRRRAMESVSSGALTSVASLDVKSPDNKFLLRVNDYITANISSEKFLMEDMASHCSVSLSSLQKKMRAITGMSPAEYVMKFRIQEAVRLLADPSLSVFEISMRLGFTSHSYFSSCFKKEMGVTPTQWRENR